MNIAERATPVAPAAGAAADRIDAVDWKRIAGDLNEQGSAVLEKLLMPQECRSLASLYANDEHFRSTGMQQTHAHASAGSIPLLASPLWVDGERLPIRRPPPALGQHNAQADWLGDAGYDSSP